MAFGWAEETTLESRVVATPVATAHPVPMPAGAEVYPTQPPEPDHRGGRLLFMLAFWFTLAASVELWWLDTPAHSVHGSGGILTECGRVTGMVAGFLLLVQVLLMSRLRSLERLIGRTR